MDACRSNVADRNTGTAHPGSQSCEIKQQKNHSHSGNQQNHYFKK